MRTLILCKCDDGCFGIWQTGRILRLKAGDLHWLPSGCPHLAGLSIINNRSITLFDLPAALGLAPIDRDADWFRILLFKRRQVSAAFLLPRDSRKGRVDPKALRPLPAFLASVVQQFWLPTAGGPVPVIDTGPLFKTAQDQQVSALKPSFALQDQRLPDLPPAGRFCRIRTGNHVFAVPSAPLAFRPARSLAVHPVAMAPEHVSGMAVAGRQLIPVLRPAKMMQLPDPGPVEEVLITRVNDALFGFEIEGRLSRRGEERLTLKPLSGVLHRPWMPAVCRAGDDLLPFLNLAALLARPGHPEKPDNGPQTPGNADFAAAWGRAAVEVFTFDLYGHKLALPKSDVVDVRPFVPPLPIPVQNRLVAGMTLWDDDIVAVLDPAACFGLRSRARPDWQLIRVKAGSSEVCILAETVGGVWTLSADQHRDLPYKATHGVLYGCCPEQGRVRLIIDVQALLELFDNDDRIGSLPLFQDVPGLQPETGAASEPIRSIETAPASQFPAAPKAGVLPEPSPPETASGSTQSTLVSETGVFEQPVERAAVDPQPDRTAPLPALPPKQAGDPHPGMAAWLEPITRFALSADLKTLLPPPKPVAALAPPEAEKSIDTEKPLHFEPPSPLPSTAAPPEKRELPQAAAASAAGNNAPRWKTNASACGAVQPGANHPVAASGVLGGSPFLPAPRDLLSETGSGPGAPVHADDARRERPGAAGPDADGTGSVERLAPTDSDAGQPVSETRDAQAQPSADTGRPRPARWVACALAVLLLGAGAAGILWLLDSHRLTRDHGPSVTRSIPNASTPDGGPAGSDDGAAPAKGRANPSAAASEKAGGGTVYRVREGDTLWGISEKFTGSGFNYDRLAEDNQIEDPNVIYPSQQLEVK